MTYTYSDSAREIMKNGAALANVGGRIFQRIPYKNQWKLVGATHSDVTFTKDSFGNVSQTLDSSVDLNENPMTVLLSLAQQDSDGNTINWTVTEDGQRNQMTTITGTAYNKTISVTVNEVEKDSFGLPTNELIGMQNLIKVYSNDDVAFTYFDSDEIPYRSYDFRSDAMDERRLNFTIKFTSMDAMIAEYNSIKVLDLLSIGSPLVQLLRRISSSGGNETDIQFNNDGSRMYFLEPASSPQVLYQQSLLSEYNVGTLDKNIGTTDRFEFSEQEVQSGRGIQFNTTGTKAYVLEDRNNYTELGQKLFYPGKARIIEFDLTDSFDIKTITNNSPNLRNRNIGTETFFGEGDSGSNYLYSLQQRFNQVKGISDNRLLTFANSSRLNRLTMDTKNSANSARDQSTLKKILLPRYVQTYSEHGQASQSEKNNGAFSQYWDGHAFPGDPTGQYAADGITWLSAKDQGLGAYLGRSGWPASWGAYGGRLHWAYNYYYWYWAYYYRRTPITRWEHVGAPISVHLSKDGEYLYYVTQMAADKGLLGRARLGTKWDIESIDLNNSSYTSAIDSDGVANFQSILHTIGVTNTLQSSRPYKDRGVYGMTLSPDCNKIYLLDVDTHAVYQYNMTSAHDLTSLNRTTLSTNPLSIDPNGFDAKLDLSAIPLVSGGPALQAKLDRIVEGASYQSNVKDFLDQSLIRSIQFNKNGTKFYVMNDVDIFEYGLSTGYDLSTATFTKSTNRYKAITEHKAMNTTGLVRVQVMGFYSSPVYSEEDNYSRSSSNLQDSGDRAGTQRMYYRDSDNILLITTDDVVNQFTADSVGNGTQPLETIRILVDSFQSPGGIALNDSNNRIYISDVNKIHRLDLSIPERINTARDGGSTITAARNISGNAIAIKPDETKIFTVDSTRNIMEFINDSAVSGMRLTNIYETTGDNSSIRGLIWNPTGSQVTTSGVGSKIETYKLKNSYNVKPI